LSICAKIFSGILAGRIREWLMYHKAQAGIIKGKQTTGYVFVIKTTTDIYLRFQWGHLYWCFLDLEKEFDSIHEEALWYKLRRKGISDNIVKCIKEMYEGIKFCMEYGEDKVTDFTNRKEEKDKAVV
jgi:hypothetical protein